LRLRAALGRAGLDVGQLDIVELNEAFASQSLACISISGSMSTRSMSTVARSPSAILWGDRRAHRGQAAALLKREGGKYALATQCIGGGQGIATVLEAAE
jgi:acetyl-CoA acyltransferase